MEYDLFFLLQDEPALHAEKKKQQQAFAQRQQQRRGSFSGTTTTNTNAARRPSLPQLRVQNPLSVADDGEAGAGLFASVGRALKSFASGSSTTVGAEWAPSSVSPRRERRNSF